MIIGIDGNEANVPQKVGVSWYVYHILREFSRLACSKLQFGIFLRQPPGSDLLPLQNTNFTFVVIPGERLWSQIALPIALWTKYRDNACFIAPAHYAPRTSPSPTIVIVHDISYRYFPQDFKKKDLYQLNNWTRYSVEKAAHVIAVSQNTKSDVIAEYGIPQDCVSVIYNGFEPIASMPANTKSKRHHFIFIGTLQPRKNLMTLLFALRNPLCEEFQLSVIGRKGWLYDETLQLIQTLKLEDRVFIKDYISEEEKNKLLAQSTALLLPGYYEGFGLPMLEAFAMGTPVIAASSGSLPEIGGDACMYVPPFAVHEWAKAMQKIVSPTISNSLVDKGKKRLKNYSWNRTAKDLLGICGNIFEKRKK